MADVFWRQCAQVSLFALLILVSCTFRLDVCFEFLCNHQPVRAAITAAHMLREMSKFDGIESSVKMSMQENALKFENLAIGVCKQAQQKDRQLATVFLECQLELWTGMTLLDLAVKSECYKFIEECCQEALDARFFGDINPHSTSYATIIAIFLPPFLGCVQHSWFSKKQRYIHYKPPPEHDRVRSATQRRIRPKGFPNDPKVVDKVITDDDLTFRERFELFWKAPITLYFANTILSWVVTVLFSGYFVYTSTAREGPVITKVKSMYPLDWQEQLVLGYHVCALWREALQLIMLCGRTGLRLGCKEYFSELWNLIDLVSVLTFLLGCFGAQEYSAESMVSLVIVLGFTLLIALSQSWWFTYIVSWFSAIVALSLGLANMELLDHIFGYSSAPYVWEFQWHTMMYGIRCPIS